jgi:replicative DNA helicase
MNREPIESLRQPPYSIESESGVLGGLMLDAGAWDRVSESLKESDFYRYEHRLIFSSINALVLKQKPIDVITVYEQLEAAGKIEEVGGLPYLNSLAQYVPSAANVRRYAETIVERSRSRALIGVSDSIANLAYDHTATIAERIDAAQGQLAKLVDDAPRDEWVGAYEGMIEHTKTIEARAEGVEKAWATGLYDLDEMLEGGLRPGELVIVGARPSMGKTALGMTIGLNMARDYSVAMLSMEMPHREVRDRMTAMLGHVSLSSVKRPSRGQGLAWGRVLEGTEKAKSLNFYVSDQGGLNINQVRSKARNMKRLHGLNVLVVDYIGLMTGLDTKMPRAYQLEEISRGLKTLAKELDMAVLCLAQVNRKVEERADQMPGLSDLRDSGAIEQDADVVVFVNRPIQVKPDLGPEWTHYAKASVSKNRNGRCGMFSLFYQGDQTRFDAWSGEPPAAQRSIKKGAWDAP